MQIDITEIKFNDEIDPQQCNSLIFKAKVNVFLNSKNEFVYQQRMIPMKKLSCKGCNQCGFLLEELDERISNKDFSMIPENIEHGALYRLETTHISRDWETGIIDDWDLEFIKIEDKKEK